MAQEEKIYKLLDSGQCPGQLVRGLEKIGDKDMGSRGMHVGGYIGVSRKCEGIFKVTCSCPSTRKYSSWERH